MFLPTPHRPSVVSLLKRCLTDDNNEVRDRATTLVRLLEQEPFGDIQKRIILEANNGPALPSTLRRQLEMYRMRPGKGLLSYEALPEVAEPVGGASKESTHGHPLDAISTPVDAPTSTADRLCSRSPVTQLQFCPASCTCGGGGC